jgi:hypothetical protein
MLVNIQMTIDAHYECETEFDVYVAAKDVENLLNETYAMNTNLNSTISTEFGDGYQVKGI